ncbi:coiled-coil domain-containing protein 146 [Electrophorus electricus]|uniref:coiled-coil domain-containing protein 146 n=1 Tax=Electrophorus electricus TaxID=8005 RepID=UPI0015D01D23|nr:coiled-coil domain-containing protein 146 [Electrophorus electricus]
MSDPKGSSNLSAGGHEEQGSSELEEPIYALAPEADSQEEHPNPISASPALQCLEELFALGKISGDKMVRLKASFNLLHATLRSSQESELKLLQEEKHFRTELEHQQQELEKAELFPDGQDTETSHMRKQILQFHNELRAAEEREYQMQYQLDCLQEEKICLEKDYGSQLKPVDEEKKYMALKESCEEMKKEIAQRREEIRGLAEDLEARTKQLQKEQQELEDKKGMIESREAELAQLLSMHGHLGKEIERITRKKMDVDTHKAALEKQLQDLAEVKTRMQVQCRQLDEERRAVARTLEGHRAHVEVIQRENSMLLKEMEMTKEKETVLLGQRGVLDINLSHSMVERKTLHETLAHRLREKERLLRHLKKMQLKLKVARDALLHTQEHYNQTKAQRDIMPGNDDLLRKMKDLQKEVDSLKLNLVHQQSVTDAEVHVVQQCVEQEQALIGESNRRRGQLHHLHALTHIKADERDQKSRELLKAQLRYSRIKQDVRGKQLQILEHKKQYQDIQTRLSVSAKLYDIVKHKRNKCVNLIQTATQRMVEMREKFKILENEIEILRTTAVNKDRLLQKARLKGVHSHAIRDSVKNDISKVALALQETRRQRDEQKLNIDQLTYTINAQKQDLLCMRQSHATVIQSWKKRSAQLLKREEEMHIYYEKVNMQECVIQEGSLEMQAIEEEIRSLTMLSNEERRKVNLTKKQVLCKRVLEEQCTLLQIQLSECKDCIIALGDQDLEERSQKLIGEDPSPVELIKKIEQLEVQLAEREAQLLEKELVYEQVTQLSERIRTKAENGKEDTLILAKKVNELQGRIKECTRQLMAVVAELAMWQAQALCLEQELRTREQQLDAGRCRLEQGLPPSNTIEHEWQRCLRHQCRRQADAEERARIAQEEEWSQHPNGVYTTAESRPNAYIPAVGSLPLPKPYGALAPFKPSEPGTNIRHIRKPQPKPIEI